MLGRLPALISFGEDRKRFHPTFLGMSSAARQLDLHETSYPGLYTLIDRFAAQSVSIKRWSPKT